MRKAIVQIGLPLVLALLGAAALTIDVPVARWCHGDSCPPPLHKLLALAEVFGHGFGVLAILLTVTVLDVRRRWMLPRLILASLGAGLVANIFKLLLARTRPHHFDFEGDVSQSFLRWLPLWNAKSYEQGFPSSHTATAVGLAIGLAWAYPRGKWLFAIFALLVAGQRIESCAHFASDALFGAAIGAAVGMAVMRLRSLGWLGDRCEIALGRPEMPMDNPRVNHAGRRPDATVLEYSHGRP